MSFSESSGRQYVMISGWTSFILASAAFPGSSESYHTTTFLYFSCSFFKTLSEIGVFSLFGAIDGIPYSYITIKSFIAFCMTMRSVFLVSSCFAPCILDAGQFAMNFKDLFLRPGK